MCVCVRVCVCACVRKEKALHIFPGLFHFTLNKYLIMLSVMQRGIKYDFLSLWYDSTWD